MAGAFHAASPLPWSSTSGGMGIPWLLRKRASKGGQPLSAQQEPDEDEGVSIFGVGVSTPSSGTPAQPSGARKRGEEALARLRSAVLSVVARARRGRRATTAMGSSVTGTIFGRRRGRVHVALQTGPRTPPALIVELSAYSTGALVREMSSGLVRIALECPKTAPTHTSGGERRRKTALVEEPTWRAYCNGRKCGYAVRRECGAEEWRVLRAVEPVSVGAGVLPSDAGADGDMMYMRARFERVVGSRDSEAFYMINPDGNAGPELSIYLLRV